MPALPGQIANMGPHWKAQKGSTKIVQRKAQLQKKLMHQ